MTAAGAFETACHSDIGGRDEQQDRAHVFARDGTRLIVLADGMGGHVGGALAAQAVVDIAGEMFDGNDAEPPSELLTAIATSAHERIRALGAERGIDPHSTCVLLHLTDGEACWAHVGDSRLYRFRDGRLVGRTVDHSVVELMRLQGRITEEEMKTHPDQNRLYEALGGDQAPLVETDGAPVAPGDAFLLASDGLWENVGEREMAAAVAGRDLGAAVRKLVARAKVNGGAGCDNIAVAVARRLPIRRSFAGRLAGALRRALRR